MPLQLPPVGTRLTRENFLVPVKTFVDGLETRAAAALSAAQSALTAAQARYLRPTGGIPQADLDATTQALITRAAGLGVRHVMWNGDLAVVRPTSDPTVTVLWIKHRKADADPPQGGDHMLPGRDLLYRGTATETELPVATLAGRMVGPVDGQVISLHGTGVQSVRLLIGTNPQVTENLRLTAPVVPNAAGAARHRPALPPGTYYYRVRPTVDNVEQQDRETHVGRIVRPAPGEHTLSFTGASCSDMSTGGPAFAAAATWNDPLTIFHGDNTYGVFADTLANFRTRHLRKCNFPDVKPLWSKTALSFSPSDHDSLENDNTGLMQPLRWANFGRLYREGFPVDVPPLTLLASGGPAVGVEHTFDWGPCRFIVWDSRSYRSNFNDTDGPNKHFLGAAQEQWTTDLLTSMPADMIAVLISDVRWQGAVSATADGWRGYPTARRRTAQIIANSGRNVMMIAGDNHCLAFDDGSRNSEAPLVTFPNYQAAPWQTNGATNYSQADRDAFWSGGAYPLTTQDTSSSTVWQLYGRWQVVRDPIPRTITVTFSGYRGSDNARVLGPHVRGFAY